MREKHPNEKIGDEVGPPSEKILFLSDVEAERNVAAETEFKTTQIVRAGTTAGERHVISLKVNLFVKGTFKNRPFP